MKTCVYRPEKRCYFSSCSVFDRVTGNVGVCPNYRGGNFHLSRKVVVVRGSVFSEHLRRNGGVVGV